MQLATSWRDKTRAALLQRPRGLTLAQIAIESGLPLYWLQALARNVSDDPGVCKIETLFNYLSAKESNVS